MKPAKSKFEIALKNPENRKFNLIILGMSGSGKTHWSKLLSQRYGYPHIEFDKLIGLSENMKDLIKGVSGRDIAEKMGNFFGMPWGGGFGKKESSYLQIERKIMSKSKQKGSVLDLTGSCIYHLKEMEAIRATGLVIYLETSLEKQKEMLQIFLSNPKPVCWKGIFKKFRGETNKQSLERCYPILLAHRAKLYERFADVTLSYSVHKNMKSPDGLALEIMKQLH